ncbi:CRE-FUT-4 protein [Caenorhabditis remanei]|uniref:Fucosyltransferase n=1 Tax=Caenorhabditis remanei TaxID=31234 RepID=E3M0S2_CAERE|nr:CRE-FUT-4 protein [Caenorhabditis remanei]
MFSTCGFKNASTWITILILGAYTILVLVCWEMCDSSKIVSQILSYRLPTILKQNVTIYAADTYYHDPINADLVLQTCPDVKKFCRISHFYPDASHADAILFHNRNFYETLNLFNWTMTYRKDADLWAPYGYLEKRNVTVNYDLNAIWNLKNKTATWLGSNCQAPNNRFFLIKAMLEKGLQADVWGSCGRPAGACDGVLKQTEPCVLELIRPYKFYLAIENSNCKDYVTEKFWKSLDDRMIVPIVMRRQTVRDLGVPDSAYIAVDDFETLPEFIQYVTKVSNDKDLYLKYHEWRRDYKVVFDNGFSGWCSLCHRIRDKEKVMDNQKSYGDIDRWHSFEMCDDSFTMKYLKSLSRGVEKNAYLQTGSARNSLEMQYYALKNIPKCRSRRDLYL